MYVFEKLWKHKMLYVALQSPGKQKQSFQLFDSASAENEFSSNQFLFSGFTGSPEADRTRLQHVCVCL